MRHSRIAVLFRHAACGARGKSQLRTPRRLASNLEAPKASLELRNPAGHDISWDFQEDLDTRSPLLLAPSGARTVAAAAAPDTVPARAAASCRAGAFCRSGMHTSTCWVQRWKVSLGCNSVVTASRKGTAKDYGTMKRFAGDYQESSRKCRRC